MDNKQIGNYIRSLRKNMGLTQGNLAEQLEVSRQAVSKWENGVAIPDVSLLPKLSKILDMDIEGILYGEPHELAKDIVGIISLWVYENKDVLMTDMVNGKPLLIYPLSMLLLCGIKNIVMFGPNDLLIQAKEILEDRIQEIDAIKFSYNDSLNSYMDHHVVLIDGNSYLYGIDLTRYLQRTIVHKNVISCVACSSEKASCEYNKIFPFVSIPSLDNENILRIENCKNNSIIGLIDKEILNYDINIEVIGRGILSFKVYTKEEVLDFSNLLMLITKTQKCDVSNLYEIIKKRYLNVVKLKLSIDRDNIITKII